MRINLLLLLSLLLFLSIPVSLQAQENDFQVWTDLSLNRNLSKKSELSFEQNLRFGNNASRLSKSYSNLSFGYSLADFVKLSLMYRFVIKNNPDYTSYGHTFGLDALVKTKINRFKLSLRNRFLLKYSEILSSEEGKVPERYYRTKVEIFYNIRKFPVSPAASFESFLFLPQGGNATIDALRSTLGFKYEMDKHQQLEAYWLNEWGKGQNSGLNDYVLGLSYSYSF